MARKKSEPLTARELEAVKTFNVWLGSRCLFHPSDKRGNEHTTKNLGDVVDQYVFERRLVTLERDVLLGLVRRYRAQKAADTKRKKKRRELRALSRRLEAVGRILKQRVKERQLEAKRQLAARQGTFEFA